MKESNGFVIGLYALSMMPDNEEKVYEHLAKYSPRAMRDDYTYYKLNKTVIPEEQLHIFELFLKNTKALIHHLESYHDQEQ